MKLTNRTILITGGSTGIGLELARQLLARNNTVLITGRDQAKLDAAREALPALHTFQSDVSDPTAIAALYQTAVARFPTLDTLINNAGIMRKLNLSQPATATDAPVDLTPEIDINLAGPVRMIQQFLPHLKSRPSALIVNVSSGLAFVPFTAAPIYSATKAGIHAFTQALRMQLRGTSVTVVELAPPGVDTQLFHTGFEEETKGQKPMPVPTLARKAIAGIEAGKLEIRPGLSNVLKLMSRIAPNFMLRQLAKTSTPKPPRRTPVPQT